MRKLLFIPLLLMSIFINAQDGQLNILGSNNSVDSRILSEVRKITFDNDNVILTNITGGEDTFTFEEILKITFEEGVISSVSNEEIVTSKRLSAYPNPVTGNDLSLQVELNESASVNLVLRNIEGEIISSITENGIQGLNELSIPLNNLSAGVYILALTSGNQTFSQRITKY